jgi:simple sugar transport system ATP-binding protein
VIAVEYIWNQLLEARQRGAACVLISEDLDELMSLCDRIGVLYKGELVEIFEGSFCAGDIGFRMINGRNE